MYKQALEKLEKDGLLRKLRQVESAQGPRIILNNKEVINLCSNNYLGLADHPALKEAAKNTVEKYGVGTSASRLISGTTQLHTALESKIAVFKSAESALVFNSGYAANVGIISALVGRGDIIFSDKLNHASIVDGCLLSGAEFKRYPHCDAEALEEMLKKCHSEGAPKGRPKNLSLIVTDTVFSMDGDIAPLPKIVALAKRYDCMLMVDEAHATGVLGENGRGAVELFGLECDFADSGGKFIQMGTLSKALGGFGAYAAGSKALIDYFINVSRPFIYTTALPASCMAAAIAAIDIIENQPELRKQLSDNIKFFRDGLNEIGSTPIIPVLIGDSRKAVEISNRLLEEGIFIQAIRPPTVPAGKARLRITIMATHTKKDLQEALEKIKKIMRGVQDEE